MYFTKRPKPTAQDLARERRLGFTIHRPADHAVTLDERLHDMEEVRLRVQDLFKAQFRGNVGLDLTILRGHLVLEMVLGQAIRFLAPVEGDPERLRLSYPQKVEILHLLGAPPNAAMFVTLELWNQLRNQLAHRPVFDRALVDQIIAANSEEEPGPLTDSMRARCLRGIAAFYAGAILGGAEGVCAARHVDEQALSASGLTTR